MSLQHHLRQQLTRYLLGIALACAAAPTAHANPALAFQLAWDAGQELPLVDYGAHQLPMRVVALQATGEVKITVYQLVAARWQGAIGSARSALPIASTALPDAPVSILARGMQRGQQMVVIGLSPLFSQNGVIERASQIRASISGVVPFASDNPFESHGVAQITAPATYLPAQQQALKISVTRAGMQQISGANAPAFPLNQLRLMRGSTELPLEIADVDGNGRVSAADTIRFYAPAPGDRWNRADTYWLTASGSTPPLRISSQPIGAGDGTARTTAFETSTWRMPKRYDPLRSGPSGDHWFVGQLTASPDLAPTAGITATITTVLPRSSGQARYTIAGAAVSGGNHRLRVQAAAAAATFRFSGTGDWRQTATLPSDSTSVILSLDQGAETDILQPDTIDWQLPIVLRFGTAQAAFVTTSSERYQLGELAADAQIYDITDASAVQRLALADRTGMQAQAAHRYLVVPANAAYAPAVQPFMPPGLTAALGAQAIYVAPAAWQPALAPLIALRQQQGYRIAIVEPQAIYDTWNAGQIAPEAIRSFLRATYVAGGGALIAATLVGDGTDDPFSYSRKPGPETDNNLNIIPPYLAPVDPWISETACETCFGQLDGDSPLADPLPDLMIGRLSVKNADQLAAVVGKIVNYETSPLDRETASRSFYIADNYHNIAANGVVTNDPAGDFAAFAERVIALQPPNLQIGRMFYDPTVTTADSAREPNSRRAYDRTKALLDSGAALVTYIGHGGSYQWATTDLNNDPGVLLGLYDPDQMKNGTRTPIMLEMTCLTSAFQVPNFYSTAIDERFLLKQDGGAVATWGSSGEGVSFGHEALMQGFTHALWATPTKPQPLGVLVQQGYLNLLATAPDAQASLRTFLILGDPLTTLRVAPAYGTYLPLVQ